MQTNYIKARKSNLFLYQSVPLYYSANGDRFGIYKPSGINLKEMRVKENLIPRDLTQLIKFLNNLRKNDRLYVRFLRQEPGAVVKGEGLPGLPPSILSILRSDRKVGAMNPIRTSTIMEYEVPPNDHLVVGARALKLTIEP